MRTTRTCKLSIVDELSSYGVRVWLIRGNIRVFPKTLLNDKVKEIISENRAALVDELTNMDAELPKPYFNHCGDLVIPFNSPRRYHWWAGGQTIKDTKKEISRNESTYGDRHADCSE